MPRNEKLSGLLRDLVGLLEEEAERNPPFARRLEAILGRRPSSKLRKERGRVVAPKEVPDVLAVLQDKGESEFRFWLRDFDLPTLRAIVKANGFDVARTSQKWSDPDKFVALIAEQAAARLRRGSGFLPERSASQKRKAEMVIVYGFEVYDIKGDRYVQSARKATSDAIGGIEGARKIPNTEQEVAASELDGNGMWRKQ